MTRNAADVAEVLEKEERQTKVTAGQLWVAYREILGRFHAALEKCAEDEVAGTSSPLTASERAAFYRAQARVQPRDVTVLGRILIALRINKKEVLRPEDAAALQRIRKALAIDDPAFESHIHAVERFFHFQRQAGKGSAFYRAEAEKLLVEDKAVGEAKEALWQRITKIRALLGQNQSSHQSACTAEAQIDQLREEHPNLFPAEDPAGKA